jgi:hypothetical protein
VFLLFIVYGYLCLLPSPHPFIRLFLPIHPSHSILSQSRPCPSTTYTFCFVSHSCYSISDFLFFFLSSARISSCIPNSPTIDFSFFVSRSASSQAAITSYWPPCQPPLVCVSVLFYPLVIGVRFNPVYYLFFRPCPYFSPALLVLFPSISFRSGCLSTAYPACWIRRVGVLVPPPFPVSRPRPTSLCSAQTCLHSPHPTEAVPSCDPPRSPLKFVLRPSPSPPLPIPSARSGVSVFYSPSISWPRLRPPVYQHTPLRLPIPRCPFPTPHRTTPHRLTPLRASPRGAQPANSHVTLTPL